MTFVRSALMISAPPYEEDNVKELVASDVEFEALKTVINDTRIGGFGRVSPVVHANSDTARNEIERFFHNREFHELLLLYFTGYELVNVDGEIYFIDKNTDLDNLGQTAIPVKFLFQQVKDSKAEKKMLIIDCFSREELDRQRKTQSKKKLAEFARSTQSFVLISEDTVGTAHTSDGTKNPGFTASLTKGLETGNADLDGRGYITEDELFMYTYRQMNQYGVAPNLFLVAKNEDERIRVAKNVQFSNLPEFAKEDSAINLGRFLRLIGNRKKLSTQDEKESLRKVIRSQPEMTFFKRITSTLITTIIFAVVAGLVTSVSIPKAIIISLIVIVGVIAQAMISRRLS